MWVLFVVIAAITLSLLDTVLGLGGSTQVDQTPMGSGITGYAYRAQTNGGILTGIFSLAIIIPNLAVAVRRLHDTDRSGWWILLPAVPYLLGLGLLLGGLVGGISGATSGATGGVIGIMGAIFLFIGFGCAVALLVFYCSEGTRGANRYGPDPKTASGDLNDVFS